MMGSRTSKNASSSSSSSSSSSKDDGLGRKKRGRMAFSFRPPCFGIGSHHQLKNKDIYSKSKDNEKPSSSSSSSSSSAEIPEFNAANTELSEENRESTCHENSITGTSSNSTSTSTTAINANNKAKPGFKFSQGNVSLRLNRALSLGSSMSHNLLFSTHDHNNTNTNADATTTTNETIIPEEDPISETTTTTTAADINNNNNNNNNNVVESERNRYRNRSIRNQDTLENSVRFSRTLSVGRLRDRVLRRSAFSEGIFSAAMLDETGGINARSALTRAASLSSNNTSQLNSDNDNNRELLERRSAFLERRRRIRSQVRALQRLGSRFENLTGHERSCILSGRHRTDRCTCRSRNRTGNSDDESNTRSSISRIVMLAEALFEVLDEIHQQSVVLSSSSASSRQSFSSIGSVPAPKETVESLPVKFYKKNPKNTDETSQCYICLVEYEQGDSMRVLPCNHDFHLTCVDKWLKEIHRVCPLCRGDVCRAEASVVEKMT